MSASVCIEQKGIVESISNHQIRIRIDRASACGDCSVNGICNLGVSSGSIIEVPESMITYQVGESVTVTITRGMGNKAIVLGYLIPFFLLMASLITLNSFSMADWITGLVSIGILGPYFFILYLLRDRLQKTITFSIHKLT